jgi:hypothetical protein
MPRPWPGFNRFRLGSTPFSLLLNQVHSRTISSNQLARKWKPDFLFAEFSN